VGAVSSDAPAAPAPSTPLLPVAAAASTGSWTTYHHDNAHTGYDGTVPTAQGATVGWTSMSLDGSIYAEPLVYNGLVYAATLNNTVYALNQSTGVKAWSTHLRTPKSSGWSCGNVSPQGILGTPVIDVAGGRIYAATLGSDNIYRLEGLNLTTGVEELNTVITTPAPSFDLTIEQERGALGIANGYVYVPFGGRAGDCGNYHGYVFAVPTNGTAVTHYYVTPGQGAGFWAAGGVVIDDSTGKVFETSGNGTAGGCNEVTPGGPPVYENDAVVRLSATLTHEDAFVPQDWHNNWCINDQDLGSATMVLISPTLAFQAGKWGTGFLVNPQALGGQDGQLFPTPKPASYTELDVCVGNHNDANFGSYAYATPYVYLGCEGNGLVALSVNPGTPSFSGCSNPCNSPSWNAIGFSPGPPIVAGGAVWAVDTGGGGLYGFDAATGTQIYHSASFGVTHFTTPSEAGGQIFVGSGTVVRSFNMLINSCTSVTESAAPGSPQPPGTPVTFTASASGCPNPLYQFWILAPSRTWQVVQAYSSTATFSWNTTGLAPGSYLYTVWARDASSPGTSCGSLGCEDAYFPGTAYSLTSQPCSSVAESAAPASPHPPGTPVTFTASASGCPNPLYQFWILRPGSPWQILQAYSSTATFSWSTTGLAPGSYLYTVWARDSSSPGTSCGSLGCEDAYFPGTAYTLGTQPCSSVTESAAPGSSQLSGTTVTFSASAAGCANPLYQFWILAPGHAWQVVQAYSSSATFSWNTTGLAPGSYLYTVWARDSGSPGTSCGSLGCEDAYFPGTAYSLTSQPCTSVTESASPGSPQAAGTTVTFTAAASGCPHPLYQFWILAPGHAWQVVQAYSSTATFSWTTSGLTPGSYLYTVWARDASSTGTSCGSLGCEDAYFPGTAYALN